MRAVCAASAVIAAILLADVAVADPVETVVVKGFSLSGIWKIGEPDFVVLNGLGSAQFGPLSDRYCRVEQTGKRLEVACLGPFILKDGEGTLEETTLHIRWGSMMLRMVVDAALQSSQRFEGTFKAKISGVDYDDPERTVGTKLQLAGPHLDTETKGDLLKTLLNEIRNTGAITTPHDPAAIQTNADEMPPLAADRLAKLGEIEVITYLGRNARLDTKETDDFLAVYDVELRNGSLLCGVHQRVDGVLDAFVCA
jgi:hypothetical protein